MVSRHPTDQFLGIPMTNELRQLEESFNKNTKIHKVYLVLKDQQWHCRGCDYPHVRTSQIAGGSGIQGLQRGTGARAGLILESRTDDCPKCRKRTRQDRWTRALQPAVPATAIPPNQVGRFLNVLGQHNIVEEADRQPSELTIDHKLPMIRWSEETRKGQVNYAEMTDDEIRQKFQVLKKSNGSVSHNLLKSRACEHCLATGTRGTPFGIEFFYEDGLQWEPENPKDPAGCVGCGWYDFDRWRRELNSRLQQEESPCPTTSPHHHFYRRDGNQNSAGQSSLGNGG
ncbi:MAG: restriction endonuclease [Synechococcus sp. SB0672_bin_10]|nr:restriction endonuclease [Synechococcus sp. SB0672_bin_10]